MFVDLNHPNLHVVERLPVRDIIDCDDVVCAPVLASRDCPGPVTIVDVTDCHRAHDVRAVFQPLLPTNSGENSSCTDFRHVGLDTIAFAIASPHVGLAVSLMTLLFWCSSQSAHWLL